MRQSKRTLTDDLIVLRIMNLLKSKKKTDKELSDHLELTHGITTAWKYGGSKSYRPHINEIAEFLEGFPNYLLRGIDEDVNLATSETEITLIKGFRTVNSDRKRHIMEMIQYIKI